MLIAVEPPPTEGLDALLPAWAQGLSLLSILVLIITSWLRGWVLTRAHAEREIDAERRIADIWKANFEQATELNEQLTGALQPILESNAAILRAVEALQARQIASEDRERAAEEREHWLRDRRDPQG